MLGIKQAVCLALGATAVLGLPIQDKQARKLPGFPFWHWPVTVTIDHTTTTTETAIATSGSTTSSQLQLSNPANDPTTTPKTTQTITVTSTSAGGTSPTFATVAVSSTSTTVDVSPVRRVITKTSTRTLTLPRGTSRTTRAPSTITSTSTVTVTSPRVSSLNSNPITTTTRTSSPRIQTGAEAIPTVDIRSIPWAAKLTKSSDLPVFTNSQPGTPGSKPTVEPALPRFRDRQVSTTLLVVQTESGADVKTHTLALPFPNNPPWKTNSDLILPPQPTDAGGYTPPEGYTVSTHLYPITQEDGIMTHTTITFLVQQTTAPTPAIVPDGDEDENEEGTVTNTAASITPVVPPPRLPETTFAQTSTVTVTVDGANLESSQKLNPRQGPSKTRTSIIWQTTTISQPNPYIDATPPPIRPRQHASGLNPSVAAALKQPRPTRPKKPKVIIEGSEAVVYRTRIATVWKGPGITLHPQHSTATETQRVLATIQPVPPTHPTLAEQPKQVRQVVPDDRQILVQSECQPFEKCRNENIEWMQTGNTYLTTDLDEKIFREALAYNNGEDYWNWRKNDKGVSGPPGGKFMGSNDGRS